MPDSSNVTQHAELQRDASLRLINFKGWFVDLLCLTPEVLCNPSSNKLELFQKALLARAGLVIPSQCHAPTLGAAEEFMADPS
mmetsp:Transcript_89655/g.178257  ORF Transcript_89655/g.178257 Transcript_89655/m.178257 type:complete len:83 (-) Transcript_89655:3024-3272(-)